MNKICLLCIFASFTAYSQKQLLVLKGQDVIKRYNPGDNIVIKRKGESEKLSSYVNNLSDTALVTHNDTIPYYQIDRIYFKRRSFLNTLGTVSLIWGTSFFLIDQFNNIIVHGNKPRINPYIVKRSVPWVVIGLPMYSIRKKSRKLGYHYRLLMVKEGSVFYRN